MRYACRVRELDLANAATKTIARGYPWADKGLDEECATTSWHRSHEGGELALVTGGPGPDTHQCCCFLAAEAMVCQGRGELGSPISRRRFVTSILIGGRRRSEPGYVNIG